MNVGQRIKQRREELGLTQLELAYKVGYTNKSTIAKIEKDANQLRQTKIKQFAEALDCAPGYLLGWEDKEETKTESVVDMSAKPNHKQMFALYLLSLLNEDGYEEAIKRVEELTQLDKYKKEEQ